MMGIGWFTSIKPTARVLSRVLVEGQGWRKGIFRLGEVLGSLRIGW
jgi:hypothetical protein